MHFYLGFQGKSKNWMTGVTIENPACLALPQLRCAALTVESDRIRAIVQR
jgi:hypothetical protein